MKNTFVSHYVTKHFIESNLHEKFLGKRMILNGVCSWHQMAIQRINCQMKLQKINKDDCSFSHMISFSGALVAFSKVWERNGKEQERSVPVANYMSSNPWQNNSLEFPKTLSWYHIKHTSLNTF